MKNKIPNPPLEIPFTDDELILMGKIAVMWGQIDEAFNSTLSWILKLPPEVYESLVGNQMIGSRLKHFKSAIQMSERPRVQKLLEQVAEAMTEALPLRNDAMHGCWGRYPLSAVYDESRIGIYNHLKPNTRFWLDQLPDLYGRLVHILSMLAELGMLSIENDPDPIEYDQHRVFFAPSPPSKSSTQYFRRGERVIHVQSKSQSWPDR